MKTFTRRAALAAGLAALAVILASCGAPRATSGAKPKPRAELKELLMGKTQAEVLEAMGKPYRTSGGDRDRWTYRGVSFDPVAGKRDDLTFVDFDKDGRVSDVSFI